MAVVVLFGTKMNNKKMNGRPPISDASGYTQEVLALCRIILLLSAMNYVFRINQRRF